jgi:hypothetical protein
MTETEIQHTTEPATERATEPVTAPTGRPVANALHEEGERITHAKNSLIHAVESAIGKVTKTLGITSGKK